MKISQAALVGGLSSVGRRFAGSIVARLRRKIGLNESFKDIIKLSDKKFTMDLFQRDFFKIATEWVEWDKMKFTRRDTKLLKGYTFVGIERKRKFATTFEMDILDNVTGERRKEYFVITHDRARLRGTMEAEAISRRIKYPIDEDISIEDIRPVLGMEFTKAKE